MIEISKTESELHYDGLQPGLKNYLVGSQYLNTLSVVFLYDFLYSEVSFDPSTVTPD